MKRLLFAIFLAVSSLQAQIIETMHLEEVREFLTPETLVIFDIDNTLMVPAQDLGTDQWFHHRIYHYIDQGMENRAALEKALGEWMSVQSITKVLEAEPGAAKLVNDLQNEGYTVMGLTSRGLGLSTRTILQLDSLGINLEKTAPTHDEFHFMNTRGVLFREGILFTSGTHKGTAFAKFLDRAHYTPKAVIFINDKHSHIVPVHDMCAQLGIPCIGMRYGYTDAQVAAFDPVLTDLQYAEFGKIMSNEEARSLLNNK
ncbi:MAG: DUF2608 domain-containing protein [Chlamydiales bacterium]|nr:DUF2608 domain-containing protein [Chlamydiia bacterium]MCP5507348.1 DUF2608 domain-containing protein [Chlamydiales bacterium]